jgi:hypothetical protein
VVDVPLRLLRTRALDSLQFNLPRRDAQSTHFVSGASDSGSRFQVFGRSRDNAAHYWNWQFRWDTPALPQTRAMLMRACDVRLPARLTLDECDRVAAVLLQAADQAFV